MIPTCQDICLLLAAIIINYNKVCFHYRPSKRDINFGGLAATHGNQQLKYQTTKIVRNTKKIQSKYGVLSYLEDILNNFNISSFDYKNYSSLFIILRLTYSPMISKGLS
ncbi:hypothetical protein BpHYR1_014059 [Brachionus plicatilis]|uniref:Uncharacterized protein n=1 Tax=Brachionus plicatilis TaxID=10195 RepID=A0A3M7T6G8_BRAPC|nr:hypothetical protein BpHYR1_014059 [Brachionus plicatilis]